jgi:CDP-glucose 4,6-dehydratase
MGEDAFWRGRRVLVTGADGFVGAWLAKMLVEARATVVTLVLDENPVGGLSVHGLAGSVVRVLGDVADARLMARVLNEYGIDSCFHLAAQSKVSVANRNPVSTFESNVRGTWTLLEQCRLLGTLERIVVSTSDKVYGDQGVDLVETHPLLGRYPYDASKVCADVVAQCYSGIYGLPIAIARFANIYGGGDLGFSRIIPYAVRCVLRALPIVLRSRGTRIRQYIHVDDVLTALDRLIRGTDRPEVRGEAFNFASAQPISVIDLVERIRRIGGSDIPIRTAARDEAGEIETQGLSCRKAADRLGWLAEVGFDEGIARTIDWYRRHSELIERA